MELEVIHDMGFDAYFLIVWDLCMHAKERGIWYNARGSAAGSLVAYAMDINMIDPLEHDLMFERFLQKGRVNMPDIDLDFQDDRRAEMMQYCAIKYGEDKVAQIITFGTMGAPRFHPGCRPGDGYPHFRGGPGGKTNPGSPPANL